MIREGSDECSITPLEWFNVPPTQTAVEKSFDVEFLPTSALRMGGVVEFYIPASSLDYMDIRNSRLYVQAKIVSQDGTDLDDGEIVAPINNLMQSMWSNVELVVNDRLVSHSNNMHGYVSILSHYLHDSDEILTSEREMQMLYKDTAGQLNAANANRPNNDGLIGGYSYRLIRRAHVEMRSTGVSDALSPVVTMHDSVQQASETCGNQGLHRRYLRTCESQPFEMLGNLRLDLFEQLRYLPNGLSMKLRLHQQQSAFVLMAPAPASAGEQQNRYKLELLSVRFIVRKIRVSEGVLLGHNDVLQKKPAQFPLVRKECKAFAIPAGIALFKQDNIFLGQLPQRVVIAMVLGDAFGGNYQRNPFVFDHFDATLVQLYADGVPVRSRPFQPNIDDGVYIECYNSLYREFGKIDAERGSVIKLDDWPRGYSLFAFSLSSDADCDDHTSLVKHGNLRVECQFGAALDQAIQLLVYAEFDNLLTINNDRQLLVDYV